MAQLNNMKRNKLNDRIVIGAGTCRAAVKRVIRLAALDKESGHLNAIIDTPKGSRNKFKYDEQLGLFKLAGMLPVGNVFPFDFGYIPSTRGDDGDALDIWTSWPSPAVWCRQN